MTMLLGLTAIVLYAGTALVTGTATLAASRHGRPRAERMTWLAGFAFFVLLIPVRLLGLEDAARVSLRGLLRSFDILEDRGIYQAIIVAVLLMAVIAVGLFALRRAEFPLRSKGWRLTLVAQAAIAGFVMLYALRIVSLHAIDRLLYAGPVRLNWVLEALLIALAGGSAILYQLHLRRRYRESAGRQSRSRASR